jgi:hypothetical protein
METNISEQVAHILYSELEYDNILMVTRHATGQTVSGGFGGGKTQLGVNTDKKVKRIGCHNFKALVEENKLIVNEEIMHNFGLEARKDALRRFNQEISFPKILNVMRKTVEA